jgi:hypothetical protein
MLAQFPFQIRGFHSDMSLAYDVSGLIST